ncbi:hypothetical protein [Amycolatopsis sp. NPDC051102]|uniref:hypothetical protein n=1 Tax=Amycolatopsis sp. NPDC051102 TaxID=3155163 RepID=UPI003419096C
MTRRAPCLTIWHYSCGLHHGTVVTGPPHDRPSLADAVIAPAVHGEADGRAALAELFDRLPGLALAVVPIRSTGLLLGDRLGETTLVGRRPAEPAAVAAYAWLITGRPLGALAAIRDGDCRRLRQAHVGVFGLVVAVGAPGRSRQAVRLVHR